MSVLVTGAAGFLGGSVVRRLLASGERNLRCFVRPSSNLSQLENLCKRYPNAHVEHIVGNLASRGDARRAIQGVDTIYHLASAMRGAPATMFRDTVVASQSLLEAVEAAGTVPRIVLTSSLGVYGTSHLPANECIGEDCAIDAAPEKRGTYAHAKIWQERLFRDYAAKQAIDLVVLRPGVLYGPGGKIFSSRVGVFVGTLLVQFGGSRNILPLSHVDNCADAVVLAGTSLSSSGQTYNVLDDDLPTSTELVSAYKQQVAKFPSVRVPYFLAILASRGVDLYHTYSHGQIPALLTPYQTAAMWKGHRYDNRLIKGLGWKQGISTKDALSETFSSIVTAATRNSKGTGQTPYPSQKLADLRAAS